jgi:hypothetical protein
MTITARGLNNAKNAAGWELAGNPWTGKKATPTMIKNAWYAVALA